MVTLLVPMLSITVFVEDNDFIILPLISQDCRIFKYTSISQLLVKMAYLSLAATTRTVL